MKKGIGIFLVALMGLSTGAMALTYFGYDDFGGTWDDVEKSPSNTDDDLMCWAATCANVLTWTGWGTAAGFATPEASFQEYLDHWTDQGGIMEYGWSWWFDGVNPAQGDAGWAQEDVDGGGDFWDPPYDFNNYYHRTWQDDQAMQAIDDYLHAGYGVGLGVYGSMSHAITVWGYEYDEAGNYLGVYITDSDDDKSDPTPDDELKYFDVVLSGGAWWLQDYYGQDNTYIGEVQGLDRYPGGEPEVPDGGATFLLLGLAAIGMGIVRKRS